MPPLVLSGENRRANETAVEKEYDGTEITIKEM